VREGTLDAGIVGRATGKAMPTDRGVRLDLAVHGATGQRDPLRALRDRTGTTIDRYFGSDAALVRALLIADQDGIATDVRDTFADAGLVHMLSVSGMHVAIIASALLTIGSAARLSRRWASVAALALVVAYVAVLGAPAPAVRSGVMLAVVMLAGMMQRPVHPWTALALGAALPTVEPLVVLDLGWQLSVSGMAALVAAREVMRRWQLLEMPARPSAYTVRAVRIARWLATRQGVTRYFVRESFTGTIAVAITAPLIAWTFGRLSLMAPIANLVAGPVVAFLQPALFLAILASPWPALAQLIADACAVPIAMLDLIATRAASVPGATVSVAPTLLTACCGAAASALVIRATAARRMLPWLLGAWGAITLAVWSPFGARGTGWMELHMLDVGQGDALAIRTPRGRWVLVDAGRRWDGGDSGRRVVVPFVRRRGGEVALFVLSHAHEDHAGGAESIVRALKPAHWWESAFITTGPSYQQALEAAQAMGTQWSRVHPGQQWDLDGVRVEVLAPDSLWTTRQRDANETSVVLRVQYGSRAMLLMGDAEKEEEEWLLEHIAPDRLRADVLKLGHHGSRTSSTSPLVEAVRPRLGLVSSGAGNRYGHPSPEILDRFAQQQIPLLRTDHDGNIEVRTDGERLEVRAGGARWVLP